MAQEASSHARQVYGRGRGRRVRHDRRHTRDQNEVLREVRLVYPEAKTKELDRGKCAFVLIEGVGGDERSGGNAGRALQDAHASLPRIVYEDNVQKPKDKIGKNKKKHHDG